MGKTAKDNTKRLITKPGLRQQRLAELLPRDDDETNLLAPRNDRSRQSRKSSRATSRVASRVASRTASPFPADYSGIDLDDSMFLSPLRHPIESGRSSRNVSRHASRIQSPDESDHELDQGRSLDGLEGNELLRRISQILSSKTSVRGANHKIKKFPSRPTRRGRQEVNAASASSQKEEVLLRLCDFLRESVFPTNAREDQIHDMHYPILISIKTPGSPVERDLALQACAMVAITSGADESYMNNIGVLKEIINNGASDDTKALAIYALTAVIFFGDSGRSDWDRLLEYLLDIVQTDGASVNAHDSALVVSAAMEAWAFVATGCELHEHSMPAMEVFIEQLDSDNSNVQLLAACNIALMFDISRQLKATAEDDAEPGEEPDATKMLDLYENPKRLAQKIRNISKQHVAPRFRQNRSTRREQLEYAAVSLDMDVGYGYSTQTQIGIREAQWYMGYSEAMKVNRRKILIKSWAVWSKIRFLQSVLGGGFANHFDDNDKVVDVLSEAPIIGLLEDWDHEPLESQMETEIRQFWDEGCPAEAVDEN